MCFQYKKMEINRLLYFISHERITLVTLTAGTMDSEASNGRARMDRLTDCSMDHMDIHQRMPARPFGHTAFPLFRPAGLRAQAQGSGPELLPQQSPPPSPCPDC